MMRLAAPLILALILGYGLVSVPGITPAFAVAPEEQLDDPVLEGRARDISQQLRCLVCQNQSIDDSDADLARDLRGEVRSLISQGMKDDDILARIRDTYGDYVLLKPPVSIATGLLWASPVLLVLLGAAGFFAMRHRAIPATGDTGAGKPALPQTGSGDDRIPASSPDLPPGLSSGLSSGLSPNLTALGIVGVLLITAGLYALLGNPDLISRPLSGRGEEIAGAQSRNTADSASLKEALADAEAQVEAAPSSVENQLRLAMVAAEAGLSDIEIQALDQALALTEGSPTIKAIKAEALSRKAGGLVTIPARNLIAEALAGRPDEPRALYLWGLAAYQDEDFHTALERWTALQAIVPPDAPLAARLIENIADAAGRAGVAVPQNTSPFANASDLSDEERAELISGMVEGLEARLAESPNDPQGWDRLIRSRLVLDDQDGMIRALIGAAEAFPDSMERQVAGLEVIMLEQREADHLDASRVLLERVNTIAPRGQEFLFFAGHFAVVSGEIALAVSFWEELESRIEPGNPLKAQLAARIASLKAEIN
jgi:cytochrome c-type biogenesis protein CcmH